MSHVFEITREPVKESIIKSELAALYKRWVNPSSWISTSSFYQLLTCLFEAYHYNLFELQISNNLMPSLCIKTPTEISKVETYTVEATRQSVQCFLDAQQELTENEKGCYFSIFRYMFGFLRPNPKTFTINREDNEIQVIFKHKKYYDMTAQLNRFRKLYNTMTPEDQNKALDKESGFVCAYILNPTVNIISKQQGEETVITISSNKLDNYEYSEFEYEVTSLNAIYSDALQNNVFIKLFEDNNPICDQMLTLIHEILLNVAMHDGAPEYVDINKVFVEDKVYLLFKPHSIQTESYKVKTFDS